MKKSVIVLIPLLLLALVMGSVSCGGEQTEPPPGPTSTSQPESWTTYSWAKDGLASDLVYCVAIDKEGNKWFGTEGGVSKFDGKKWTSYSKEDGLADNAVRCIAIDNEGNKWFGTGSSGYGSTYWYTSNKGSGVTMFDGTSWTTFTTEDGLASNYVSAIAIDTHNNKWFGTPNGVSKFDGVNWTTYTTDDGLIYNGVLSIAIDHQGNIWFGTSSGISMFDGAHFTNYKTPYDTIYSGDSEVESAPVSCIAIDTKGNKWFGTYGGGVTKLNSAGMKSYSVDEITYPIYTPDGPAFVSVHSIAVDERGNLWFAISSTIYGVIGGMSRFDGQDWSIYTTAEGWDWLSCMYVTCLAIDNEGNKWLGTDKGVIKLGKGTPAELSHEKIFADSNIEVAVRDVLMQETGKFVGVLQKSDLLNVKGFSATNSDISNLTGLEYCKNIDQLYLNGNVLSDISQLSSLTKLWLLHLGDNQISDITPLSNLTNLQVLYLWNNKISDISALSGLTNLEHLQIEHNQISDLSPLIGLTKLTGLSLVNNKISDVSPLLEVDWPQGWITVDLHGNPLSEESLNIYVPELKQKGVDVFYNK